MYNLDEIMTRTPFITEPEGRPEMPLIICGGVPYEIHVVGHWVATIHLPLLRTAPIIRYGGRHWVCDYDSRTGTPLVWVSDYLDPEQCPPWW